MNFSDVLKALIGASTDLFLISTMRKCLML